MARDVLFIEPVGGIAGDMFLAAAVDLGVPLADLERQLRTLELKGWRFETRRDQRHQITGTHLDVIVDGQGTTPHDTNGGHHPHGERGLKEIVAIIEHSQLAPKAKERALAVFHAIGVAEAKVHGVPVEKIHFHEVGAVDSIIDICGAAVVLDLLGDPEVFCSPPPLGSGTVTIAHGTVPVPVPATMELLKGLPVRFEGRGELTTPTGAALVKCLTKVGLPPPMSVKKLGYGVGTKDFPDRANVVRLSLGERTAAPESDQVAVLEANLDDCSPQILGALMEQLISHGALDAWIAPVTMKKGRPGHLLGALAPLDKQAELTRLILAESTTLGVRHHLAARTILERKHVTVETPYGPIRIKLGLDGGKLINATPEFEDCRAAAEKAQVPLKTVIQAALAAHRP
ncbi:MAG: nickel pincer cofactor biosynthesis protein LarC [Myxococcaceae bacterium]